ncbi:MAG: hypothetical protein ACRD88_12665 [Terriglobia bacterium]
MSLRVAIYFAVLAFAFKPTLGNAQSAVSHPQGVAVLTQALNASGAANPLSPVRGFTAQGTITYFWAGDRVQAPATLRARGHNQFRIDANLPSGARSVAVNRLASARKDSDGRLTDIPAHNTMSMGFASLPYLSMAVALSNPAFTVSYVGLVQSGGRQLHQVRVTRNFPRDRDPDGILAGLSRTDYFVDAQTLLVSKTEDSTHPIETLTESFSHEVEFEGYTAMSGVAVPNLIREKVAGQTMSEFRLSTITFNTNLSDTDFSLR